MLYVMDMWHSDKTYLPDIVGGASAEKNDNICLITT